MPAQTRITAILYEGWGSGVRCRHLLQVHERNVAHAKVSRPSRSTLFRHRFPDFGVAFRPTVTGRRPMQHKAVDMIGSEMLQRTVHRLRNLHGKRRFGIVGQTMVLTRAVSELRLNKKIAAGHNPRAVSSGRDRSPTPASKWWHR